METNSLSSLERNLLNKMLDQEREKSYLRAQKREAERKAARAKAVRQSRLRRVALLEKKLEAVHFNVHQKGVQVEVAKFLPRLNPLTSSVNFLGSDNAWYVIRSFDLQSILAYIVRQVNLDKPQQDMSIELCLWHDNKQSDIPEHLISKRNKHALGFFLVESNNREYIFKDLLDIDFPAHYIKFQMLYRTVARVPSYIILLEQEKLASSFATRGFNIFEI